MSVESKDRYSLLDADGNEWIMENAAQQIIEDAFPTDVDVIERSYTEGAIAPGETRGTAKVLSLTMAVDRMLEQDYRDLVNELFYRLRVAVTIRDRINLIETDIRPANNAISYDAGGFLHGSTIAVELIQLIPFWRDIEFREVSETSTLSNQLIVDNDGYFETPPLIILETKVEIPKFLVKIEETGEGIGVNDLNFGKVNLDTYVINNEDGEILLGSDALAGILRNDQIIAGTGFFNLRRGINTITVFTALDRDLDVKIMYKRRFWI